MLGYLRGKASNRKLQLFVCAAVRLKWDRLTIYSRGLIETAERYWDGPADSDELAMTQAAVAEEHFLSLLFARRTPTAGPGFRPLRAALNAVEAVASWSRENPAAKDRAYSDQANLLREIFGNPFGQRSVDPNWLAWNGHTVPNLAHAIHRDLAFDRLPVLADALEDAGCDDVNISNHCRHLGKHVRGCWVVDLVTGKV
jgi:hypothetical protein